MTDPLDEDVAGYRINQDNDVPAVGPGAGDHDAVVPEPRHRTAYALTRREVIGSKVKFGLDVGTVSELVNQRENGVGITVGNAIGGTLTAE